MNKVLIAGNIGKQPQLQYTQSGKAFCNLSIATTDRVKKDEKWEKQTDWHNVTLWGKRAENAAQYLGKGSRVAVEGKLQTRSFEKDGHKQYKTEIVVSEIEFLSTSQQHGETEGAQFEFAGQAEAPSVDDIPF